MTSAASSGLLRTLTWYETIGYAPTRAEFLMTIEHGAWSREQGAQIAVEIEQMRADGIVVEQYGRFGFPESASRIIETIRARDAFQPRKRRRAARVAYWLSRLPSVRFVALANTTALGFARDTGDLDFFVVARAGTIWTTRLLGGLPFRLLGMTPSSDGAKDRDAICLSYFVTDDALDLSLHQLPGNPDMSVGIPTSRREDPYFRYWFLSLLPLYDDGVSHELWEANATLREQHPFVRKWIVAQITDNSAQCAVRSDCPLSIPTPWSASRSTTLCRGIGTVHCPLLTVHRFLEPLARWMQLRWFPRSIRERMNRDTTVIVSDSALKFHLTDRRAAYRETYDEACQKRGIEPYA